ncbi:restriction endonuclease [bacterium BD-1]|uniref:restriction endonuclease n=1 Tax=Arenimonas sp. TaxID=1872635 RepID=UPI001E421C6B|nr:restriction endonuclease [Ottowia caeni]
MARRRESGFDVLASMPWPVGLIAGVLAFLAVRYGVPWYLGRSGGTLGQAFASGQAAHGLGVLAWSLLLICWLASAVSFATRRHRARLLDSQALNPRLTALSWREFEQLVGEWFRRKGYYVEETGGGGKDGGIDLLVRKDGRKELVQCKQWRRQRVDVATVREMWGLLQHHGADEVWIVCIGNFTPDAARFAQGKPIRLISGRQLEDMIRSAPGTTAGATTPPNASPEAGPACPKCGSPMAVRHNRKTGDAFLGCTSFPRCRETAPYSS